MVRIFEYSEIENVNYSNASLVLIKNNITNVRGDREYGVSITYKVSRANCTVNQIKV